MRTDKRVGRRLIAGLIASAICAGTATASALLDHPEQRLREAVDAMHAGRIDQALRDLDQLVHDEPNFRLAQLLYSQMLATRAGAVNSSFSSGDAPVDALIEEARLRLNTSEPPPGSVPASILSLSARHQHALLADLPRARLYLLENRNGSPQVLADFYVAVGKDGYGKQVMGDNRTPVGVYRIINWLAGSGLPELYGAGAFPTNYPNVWDRSLGKTGYGIWLHGVPDDTYTRAPRSSEGCVTVANADLLALRSYIQPGETPIILSDGTSWLPAAEAAARRATFLARIESWRAAWSAKDTEAYLGFYSKAFTVDNMDLKAFSQYKRRVNGAKRYIDVTLQNLDVYLYPGEDNLVLAEFDQDYKSDSFATQSHKQQYWRLESDGQWRIVREESD